ncbi:MAG: DUF58 domain-containing protein [Chloroflexi bacterium]|nr:DUF58 domain-containing protein [Chloroflexota bacterium]
MIRRLQFLAIAVFLLVAAFSTGADFLFFLVYLGLLVIGGAYVVTRFGLSDLEAGYVLDKAHAHVGDTLRATYTLRNTSRLPKLWLEVHNPSTLPAPLPGRALALQSRAERTWVARVPLIRRGHFRVDPMTLRTGDPFGLFESYATVGAGSTVIVYPRLEALPRWRIPPAFIEGSQASPERTLQTTPLVTSVRPYVPGDDYKKIHWKSSARQMELQVKEFDLEQTADVAIYLDLERRVHTGEDDESTIESAVRVAAAVSARALAENRAVAMTAAGHRTAVLPADRGARQQQKVMQLLAAVNADGDTPLRETLVQGLPRLRRGMIAVVITPSVEREWVAPLSGLRARGVATVVCLLDAGAYDDHWRREAGLPLVAGTDREDRTRNARAIRHGLAEYDLPVFVITPQRALSEIMVAPGFARQAVRA